MAEKGGESRGFRVWPGLAVPISLTLILAAASALFVSKVSADQERADAEALDLERFAREEAGRIAVRAREAAMEFVESRRVARSNQERNLRLEAKGVLDAVYRLLNLGLERAARGTTGRREVGALPHGFDGMRLFLEMPPPGEKHDASLSALRAMGPELSELLPSGSALTVIEDNSRELLSLGGAPVEGSLTAASIRDFLFNDGSGGRHWTLRVELAAPDGNPSPEPAQIAERIAAALTDVHPRNVAWRGWLLGSRGAVLASFPPYAEREPDPSLPPFIDKAREWVVVDDNRLVWLEKASGVPGLDLLPAAAVAIDRPSPPMILADEFWKDRQWSMVLGGLAFLCLGGWAWFVRSLARSGRGGAGDDEAVRPEGRAATGNTRQRLVRDAGSRAISGDQGVIIADIGDDGRVRVEAPPSWPRVMPGGSLARLQAIHRGREGAPGSRILDQARSPVLRELAGRVRPAIARDESQRLQAHAAARAKATEKIAAMKSVTGWKKIEE